MAKFATNANGAMLLPNLVQVTESISGSVVPLAMFIFWGTLVMVHGGASHIPGCLKSTNRIFKFEKYKRYTLQLHYRSAWGSVTYSGVFGSTLLDYTDGKQHPEVHIKGLKNKSEAKLIYDTYIIERFRIPK